MAGQGYNNRRGLGLGEVNQDRGAPGGFQTGEYRRPGMQAEPMFDADPYAGGAEMQDAAAGDMPGGEQQMGDGWSDAERAYRDEVEADPENELYLRAQEWKRKWLQKAEEFGLDSEKAMRVLDSIGDFDAQEPGDPGYGEDEAY